jgi:uncharacterized membrane protein YdfJ with MMPL/SSD domain
LAGRSARLITLAMLLAFTRFVGVLVDSFIVRSYMVPGLISLFGEASWWPLATPAGNPRALPSEL